MSGIKWIAILTCALFTAAQAQLDYGFDFSKSGTSGFQFLKIGVGAEQVAFGSAASSTVDDAAAVFWNPAGLGWLEEKQVLFAYNQWLVNTDHAAMAFAMPIASIVAGLSIAVLNIEQFEETTVDNPTGTGRMVDAGDFMIGISVARKYTDQLTIGAQIKFVQEKLDDVTFNNILFDIGTIYYTGFRDLRLSFTLQHFGPDKRLFDQNFKMPLIFRVGAADHLMQSENLKITTAFDLVHPTDNNEWVNWGIELEILKYFALRGGYRFNVDEGDFSLGFGLIPPSLNNINIKIDYAYVPYGDVFDTTHRFSLAFGL